jgi:hypothetical protein
MSFSLFSFPIRPTLALSRSAPRKKKKKKKKKKIPKAPGFLNPKYKKKKTKNHIADSRSR